MTASFGLLDTGFVVKSFNDIVSDMSDQLKNRFGSSVFGETSVEKFLMTLVGNAVAEIWELAQAIVSSQDPDVATGILLDAICALTGTLRDGTAPSTATATLTGDPGTVVASGSQERTSSTQVPFTHDVDATLVALAAWTATHAYVVDDRVTNAGRCYLCIDAGTSAGSGGPNTTAADITDGTAHWRYLGDGTAAVDVATTCTIQGPTVATSGDLKEIVTPVVGWSGVVNVLDATLGRDVQTDESLRVTREAELAAPGNASSDAIRANLLRVADVTAATVFVNDTDATVDTMPPHSVEALVTGGVDQTIADTLWTSVAAGIVTTGSTPVDVEDSAGFEHTIRFSRPTAVPVSIRIDLTYFQAPTGTTPAIVPPYPADGDTQVIDAVVAYGDLLPVGVDAVGAPLGARAFGVDGVLDVTQVLLWTAALVPGGAAAIAAAVAWIPSHSYLAGDVVTNDGRTYVCITPGLTAASGGPNTTSADITDNAAHWRWLGATIVIDARQRATYDTSRVTLVKTTGSP